MSSLSGKSSLSDKNKLGDKEPIAHYSWVARLLHRLALSSDAVATTAFDLDCLLHKAGHEPDAAGPPVFIAGLARAGTTLLMRLLYESDRFCSLTYRDMPFVMAPNLWRRLSAGSRRAANEQERAHGDGLLVGYDSPEALEEVFWRIHCRDQYLHRDRLTPMTADADVVTAFCRYIAQVLTAHSGGRYLSKNNNNILRLPALRQAFPDAVILVPFRDPLQQARSLWQQHRRFQAMHAEQPFVRQYMTWLVHHEFGSDHRPFDWRTDTVQPLASGDTAQPEYWLRQWLNAYRYLLEQAADSALGIVLVDYDRLCREPAEYWSSLATRVGISPALPEELAIRPPAEADTAASPQPFIAADRPLMSEAVALHARLMQGAACSETA